MNRTTDQARRLFEDVRALHSADVALQRRIPGSFDFHLAAAINRAQHNGNHALAGALFKLLKRGERISTT